MLALLLLLIFFVLVGMLVVCVTYPQAVVYSRRVAEMRRAQAEAIARERELDPRQLAKIEADRRFLLEMRRLEMEQWIAMTRFDVAQYGTILLNQEEARLTHIAPAYKPAQIAAPLPAQSSLQIAASQPSMDWLMSQLTENSLTVSPGVRAADGTPVIVDITAVPHLKIIGSTGFGKSCLAAAMMRQATELNDPDVLQLALLDLEHKTSRLFENLPHVARLTVGARQVDMVATNADEVVQYLGFLKRELDRRTRLTVAELAKQPVLLMYVEEMLALQYEDIPEKLLARMFADLTILAVRGRKYSMFLLACMQTDYSTKEMQITQKMFRFRSAAAIDTTAARAAGFMNTDLIRENFATGKPGQFVIEFPAFSGIVLAPVFDVKRELGKLSASAATATAGGQTEPIEITPGLGAKSRGSIVEGTVKISDMDDEMAQEASRVRVAEVADLRALGWGKLAIIEKIWRVKAGATRGYQRACEEYEGIIASLEEIGA